MCVSVARVVQSEEFKREKKIQILAGFSKKNKKNVFRVFKMSFLTPLTQRERESAFSLSLSITLLARALCFVCLEEEEENKEDEKDEEEKQLRRLRWWYE